MNVLLSSVILQGAHKYGQLKKQLDISSVIIFNVYVNKPDGQHCHPHQCCGCWLSVGYIYLDGTEFNLQTADYLCWLLHLEDQIKLNLRTADYSYWPIMFGGSNPLRVIISGSSVVFGSALCFQSEVLFCLCNKSVYLYKWRWGCIIAFI